MADEEVQEEEGGLRSQMWKHEAMVEWINAEEEIDLDTLSAAEIIAYAFAKRVAWRKTDTYRGLVAEHAETAEQEKAAAKVAREKAAAEKKAAKEAEDAAKAEKAEKAEKTTAKATKAAAPAAKATKATGKATKATKKSAGGDENPFG